MKYVSKVLTCIKFILIMFLLCFFSSQNGIIALQQNIETQQNQIETALQMRSDLIPNLVETVKGYVSRENEVFTSIAEARAKLADSINNGDLSKISEASFSLDSAIGRLIAISEDYPELKASEQFIALQDELAGTENRISVARQYYNETVKTYNTAIQQFPQSIVANISRFYPMEYFEADGGAYEVPQVSFD